MSRFFVATLLAAFTLAAAHAGYAADTKEEGSSDNVKLLGHLSDKDKPVAEATDTAIAPPAKDPSFNPVSKLGNYPNETAPVQPNGRTRDVGSDKLNSNTP